MICWRASCVKASRAGQDKAGRVARIQARAAATCGAWPPGKCNHVQPFACPCLQRLCAPGAAALAPCSHLQRSHGVNEGEGEEGLEAQDGVVVGFEHLQQGEGEGCSAYQQARARHEREASGG